MCWPCDGATKVDTDRWRTREGLPDITGCGTTKDAGSGEDRWPSAFQNSFRVFSVFRGRKLSDGGVFTCTTEDTEHTEKRRGC
jgi:hypothetical protein